MLSRLKKDEWIIAIRKRGEEQFRIIPNTLRYWCADPFVKEIDGHTFLLFEMYDRLKGKGLIGYRKFDGIKWGETESSYRGRNSFVLSFRLRRERQDVYNAGIE